MKIPYHKPIIPKNINSLFSESIRAGWLTTGPIAKQFEDELAKYLNAKNVIAVNSCTAALHLALVACRFKKGSKFIAPTYTFASTVEVGEYVGLEPILVDCMKDSYNIDLNIVETLLKNDNKIVAVLPVHFAGYPLNIIELNRICLKYNTFLLEDAAHGLETISNLGKVGDTKFATAFSFYANKNITTGGEGGALATDNDKFANLIRKLSLHGMSKDGWKRYKHYSKWAYDISELGFKYNMSDVSASFGLNQLEKINIWLDRRNEIAKIYLDGLANIEGIFLPKIPGNGIHAWHLFVIKINKKKWRLNRDQIIEKLNSLGIGTSVHYIPIHMHTYFNKKYKYEIQDFPIATDHSKSVISLPIYPALLDKELKYIIYQIRKIWLEYHC
mgnify:CR=1 FL=1|tara:strand:- start:953 stop:2113 length:1161 start_codon:yes stop_codon:yes gene_type:complete